MPPSPNGGNLYDDVRRMADQVSEVRIAVQRIESTMVSRNEIEQDIQNRVGVDAYRSDQKATEERLTRLESGPQRNIAWVSLAFGAVGCLGTLVAMSAAIFTIIWTLSHAH